MKYPVRFACCASLILSLMLAVVGARPAYAASGWDYKAGNIISDAAMRNYNSMDAGAIQSFLKSKNSCNDTRTYIASWYPSVYYHIENGHFVCMADESFNGKSAAQIIYQAAQDYKINPQVLIVTLQKEQGLVTDTYPHSGQYRTAMGYGCPDASQCEAKYYGFENQVRNAAALFNTVLNGGWTNYPVGSHYILYSPRSGCGGSNVYVENLATAALYRYTPYQPNDAAKNAGYGTGDGCSTYGNRNFYLYFTDWFGSTQTASSGSTPMAPTEFYVPDGDYKLLTTTGRALDVYGADTKNGANVNIWSKNDTAAQIFHIARRSDGYYRITSPDAGKSLDVNGASTTNGANVQLWDSNESCAQKWAFQMSGSYYVLRNACSGMALDVLGAHLSTNGVNVDAWEYHGGKAQQWRLVALDSAPVKGGTYNIKTVGGTTSLDVYGAEKENGTNIDIWASHTGVAQKFKLARATDGYYRITNPNADKSVDVYGAKTGNGANVSLWESNDTCAQKWAVSKVGEHYAFRNACSGRALDVYGAWIYQNGGNVDIWDYHGGVAQQWDLKGTK